MFPVDCLNSFVARLVQISTTPPSRIQSSMAITLASRLQQILYTIFLVAGTTAS
jgi:hypothetical protein